LSPEALTWYGSGLFVPSLRELPEGNVTALAARAVSSDAALAWYFANTRARGDTVLMHVLSWGTPASALRVVRRSARAAFAAAVFVLGTIAVWRTSWHLGRFGLDAGAAILAACAVASFAFAQRRDMSFLVFLVVGGIFGGVGMQYPWGVSGVESVLLGLLVGGVGYAAALFVFIMMFIVSEVVDDARARLAHWRGRVNALGH
jgi:hypothetical protein